MEQKFNGWIYRGICDMEYARQTPQPCETGMQNDEEAREWSEKRLGVAASTWNKYKHLWKKEKRRISPFIDHKFLNDFIHTLY